MEQMPTKLPTEIEIIASKDSIDQTDRLNQTQNVRYSVGDFW
jgi:hypothetical protein